jgi:hypothetical protein
VRLWVTGEMMPGKRVTMRLWRLWWDVRRIFRGAKTFGRYLLVKQDLEVGLGLLSAASGIARQGQPNHYMVRVANATRHSLELTLTLRVQAAKTVDASEQHHAYYTKRMAVHPCLSTAIAIESDWMGQVDFQIAGVSSPPDDFWRAETAMPRFCSLTALLSDATGAELDALTIYQELMD